jgi:hypothetical protein
MIFSRASRVYADLEAINCRLADKGDLGFERPTVFITPWHIAA